MIIATLKDLRRYKPLGANLSKAIDWLAAGGWDKLPDGKHEIDGQAVFALVSHYNSKALADARYETHRDYIDIQLLVSGKEIVQARAPDGLAVTEPWKPDIEFYAAPAPGTDQELFLAPGTAMVFFPEDAHRPCIAAGGVSEPIHKVVVKVAL